MLTVGLISRLVVDGQWPSALKSPTVGSWDLCSQQRPMWFPKNWRDIGIQIGKRWLKGGLSKDLEKSAPGEK